MVIRVQAKLRIIIIHLESDRVQARKIRRSKRHKLHTGGIELDHQRAVSKPEKQEIDEANKLINLPFDLAIKAGFFEITKTLNWIRDEAKIVRGTAAITKEANKRERVELKWGRPVSFFTKGFFKFIN